MDVPRRGNYLQSREAGKCLVDKLLVLALREVVILQPRGGGGGSTATNTRTTCNDVEHRLRASMRVHAGRFQNISSRDFGPKNAPLV